MKLDKYLGDRFDGAGFKGKAKAPDCRRRFVEHGEYILRTHGRRRDTFCLSRADMAKALGLTDRQMRTLIGQWVEAGLIRIVDQIPNGLTTYSFTNAVRNDLQLGGPALPGSIPESPATAPLAGTVLAQSGTVRRSFLSLQSGETTTETSRETSTEQPRFDLEARLAEQRATREPPPPPRSPAPRRAE